LAVKESLTVVFDAGCPRARPGQEVNLRPIRGISLELVLGKPEISGIPGPQGHEHFQDVSLCLFVGAQSVIALSANMDAAKFHKLFELRIYHSTERVQKELVKSYPKFIHRGMEGTLVCC
jgi:hypothetical protein